MRLRHVYSILCGLICVGVHWLEAANFKVLGYSTAVLNMDCEKSFTEKRDKTRASRDFGQSKKQICLKNNLKLFCTILYVIQ